MTFRFFHKIRLSPFIRDVFATAMTTGIVMVCNIILIRMIAKGLGPEELGAYTLVRRTVAILLPFTSLSIGISVARYIALYAGKGQKTALILPASIGTSVTFSLLICLILLPFSHSLSLLIFNQGGRDVLFTLILFLLIGENLYSCLYSYYRGHQQMMRANMWEMLIMGILPLFLVSLLLHFDNLSYIVAALGILFYFSLASILPKLWQSLRNINLNEFIATAKELLAYSIPRAPGGVALTMIFTFGVLVSPYMGGIVNAAYMSIGIWIFQILQTVTTSFGLVVLPKAANLLGSGNEEYLKNKVRSIYDLILHIGIFTVIQLFISLDYLIFIWLGQEYEAAVPIARIIILAMIPFFYYVMMRNIIDALEKRAINAFNVYLSLFVTIILSLILVKVNLGLSALALGLDTGLFLLGFLTYLYINRRYHIRLFPDNIFIVIIMNTVMGIFIYSVKYTILLNQFSYKNFAIVVLLQLLCGLLYLLFLKNIGTSWIKDIEERIFVK